MNGGHKKMRMLIWTMTLMLAGCGLGMTAEQRVDKAREYLAGDNAPAAIIELKNALQEDPVNLEARLLLAEASYRAGDAETAVKEYQRALDLGAELEQIRVAFAEAQVRAGNADKALELADLAGVPTAELGRIHWIRGLALTGLGQFDAAEAALDEARKNPEQAFAVEIALARLELARGDSAAARGVLEGIAAAGEENSEYWEVLGFVQLRDRQPGAAAESFGKAARLASEPFGGRRFVLGGSRAEALLADGDVTEARKVAERLYREARQHPMPNYLMSRVEYQSGNYQQALAYAQALLSIQPGLPIGNILAGAASLSLDQPAQAENYLASAVETEPGNVTARKLLAQVRLGLGSPQDALATLRPVAGLDAEAAAMAGMASIRAGDPGAAIAMFRSQLTADPENDRVRLQLAVSLMAAGRNDEALAELGLLKGLDEAGQLRADLVGVAVHLRAGDLAAARSAARATADSRPGDSQARNTLGALFMSEGQAEDGAAWFEDALQVDPGNAIAEFNLGRIAAAAGRTDEAEARFNAVLKAEPDNAAAQTALAQAAWGAGRREEAIRRLESLRIADGAALPPQLLLVRYLQASGESGRALEVARQASSAHPRDAEAAHTLGVMLLDAGQVAEALRAFERADELAPGTPQYLVNRGRAHVVSGQIDEARRDMRNALAVDPDYTPARLALVDIERRSGRLDAAGEALARLKTTAEPDDPAVALLEGELLLAQRDYERAIPRFATAIDGEMGGRAISGLFQAQLRSGKPEPERTLEDALRASPGDMSLRVLAADHYLSTGRFPAAAGHYEKLVEYQPDNPMLLNNLAWLYSQGGDPRAVSLAERAHQLAPESPMIMDTYGWILHQRGETRRALELISEAARLAPDVGEIRFHYAVLLKETGDRAGAIREARAVLTEPTAVQHHAEAQSLLDRLEQGKE